MFTKSPKFDTLVKGITALPVRNTKNRFQYSRVLD